MATVGNHLAQRLNEAVHKVSGLLPIEAVYLFGSQSNGTAHPWSDIDLAIFAEGVEHWDRKSHIKNASAMQKSAGDDLELHFFPASYLTDPPVASFAEYVLKNGIRIDRGGSSCPD